MLRRRSYQLWLLLHVGLSACSQIVDFDRAKIAHDDLEMDAGMVVVPDGGGSGGRSDGGSGGGARLDAAIPDVGVEPGVRCMRDSECAADELCCEQECRKTSIAQCASCTTGCPSGAASACSARTCVCGTGPVCTMAAPYCLSSGAGSECAECQDAKDCQARSDGKTQCVAGSCATCNPADNAGCTGTTPICNVSSRTCERCSAAPDNCPGSLVCTATGACGGCSNAATDCTTPTSPICDSATTQCKGCAQGVAGDSECMAQRQKPFCEAGRCGACRPASNMGCDPASATPVCRTNSAGQNECQACAGNADCRQAPRSLCNTDTGRCVECTSDLNCADPAKPYCDTDGTCKGCGATGGNQVADLWCTVNTLTLRPGVRPQQRPLRAVHRQLRLLRRQCTVPREQQRPAEQRLCRMRQLLGLLGRQRSLRHGQQHLHRLDLPATSAQSRGAPPPAAQVSSLRGSLSAAARGARAPLARSCRAHPLRQRRSCLAARPRASGNKRRPRPREACRRGLEPACASLRHCSRRGLRLRRW